MAEIIRRNILLELQARTRNAERSLRNLEGQVGGLNGIFRQAAATFAGMFAADIARGAISQLRDLGRTALDNAISFEQTRVAFTTFLGSAEEAEKVLGRLNEFSRLTPFEPEQVNEAGKALLAFGVEADDLTDTLRRVGDISAGTGKDFNELAVIFGKARVSGTLFAEDINQLTEAGVPVIQEFAKQLGVSESQVKKLASEGAISFDNLEQAFTDLTGEGGKFFNLMEAQSQTLGGRISTLQGNFNELLRVLGEAFLPILGRVVDKFTEFIQELNTDRLREIVTGGINIVVPAFERLFSVIGNLVTTLTGPFKDATITGQKDLSDFEVIINAFAKAVEFVADVISIGVEALSSFFDGVKDLTRAVTDFLGLIDREEVERREALAARNAKLAEDNKKATNARLASIKAGFAEQRKQEKTANDATEKGEKELTGKQLKEIEKRRKAAAKAAADKAAAEDKARIRAIEAELQAEQEMRELRELAIKEQNDRVKAELQAIADKLEAEIQANAERIASEKETAEIIKGATLLGLEQERAAILANTELTEMQKATLIEDLERRANIARIEALEEKLKIEGLSVNDELALLRELNDAKEALRQEDLAKEGEAAAERLRLATEIAQGLKDIADQVLAAQIEKLDAEIALQQERVNKQKEIIDKGNAEQVEAEEKRLRRLLDAREDAQRRQAVLDRIAVISAQAVAAAESIKAISKAFGSGNILAGIATSVALVAQVATIVSQLRGTFGDLPAFKEGTPLIDGPGTNTSDSILARLSKGERVVDAQANARYFDTLNEFHNQTPLADFLHNVAQGKATATATNMPRTKAKPLAVDNSALESKVGDLADAVNALQMEVRIDQDGFSASMEKQLMKRKRLKNLLN